MIDLLRVGTIASTHGIRGEVKVFPTTDDINRFKKLKHCILDTGREKLELEVESVKFFKQFAIFDFFYSFLTTKAIYKISSKLSYCEKNNSCNYKY